MIAGFSITSLLLILLAGIGAGFVGYAVGASSLVSYPALLAFGIPPVLANASNTVGVVGTGIGGVMGARKELKGQAVRSITYVVIGAFGGVAGAFLLLKLDPSVFEFAAPVLILLSSLIIAINPRGRMQAKQAAADATAQLKHIEATEATEAAKRATKKAPLRHNAVQIFDEKNTGNNTGVRIPYTDWEIIPDSDECTIYCYLAGGGCSLPGTAKVFMPVEGYEGVVKFIFDLICERGINACPPLLVGIGIAGSAEVAAVLSKKALMRPVGSHNSNTRGAEFEQIIAEGLDKLNIGPNGLGGTKTVMGVNVEQAARHPSCLAAAVNVGCWAHRRAGIRFKADLSYEVFTHKGVTL